MLAENDLGLYCVPRKALHRPASEAVMRGQVWEAETLQFLIDHAAGDIVHGGTFFGDFLPALSRAYERVWAFEPNVDSFKCAAATILLNDLDNVELRNGGLGASAGNASLTTEQEGVYLGGGSFIVENPGDVRLDAIDDVIPSDRNVAAIHLDVEGYERQALEGARKTIQRCRPIIIIETVPGVMDGYEELARLNANHVFVPIKS